jgi:hypothetical protein
VVSCRIIVDNMWTRKEADHVRLKIKNWLTEHGYVIHPQTFEGQYWTLVAVSQSTGMGCGLSVNAESAYTVDFAATVPLSVYHRAYEQLQRKEKRDFIIDLRLKLFNTEVSFSLPIDPIPVELTFQRALLKEDLSKSNVLRAIVKINEALLTTIWSFQRQLDTDELPGNSSIASFDTIQ